MSERRSGGCAGSVVLVDALLPAYSKRQPKGCLLTKHFFFSFFFFLEYCWVCSSRILWAPSLPPQPFEDASESFSRRYRACFSADVSNEYCNAAAAMQRGYLGSKDRCGFNVKLAAEGLSLYSCCAAQR